MAKGISLHFGLNAVDPAAYQGWSGPLNACEADARDMQALAQSVGYESQLLLTERATRAALTTGIADAAARLASGDIFLLTISSHGGQLPDLSGDEDDSLDETWCLFDGQVIDDEVSLALTALAEGVRVVVVSDSCHSGTMVRTHAARAIYGDMLSRQAAVAASAIAEDGTVRSTAEIFSALAADVPAALPRVMPAEISSRIYFGDKPAFDARSANPELKDVAARVKASVILLSGCQDNQLSMDGPFNGAFTARLKTVWNGGGFSGGYDAFVSRIVAGMEPTQTPGIFRIGKREPAFDADRPFTI
ncbi:MAG: caspase family protein [Novosphingobium sp.]